jgi:hypothetical protein
LKDAWEYVEAPRSTFRESRPLRKFPNYMALMSRIIDVDPSSFEGAEDQEVWKDGMMRNKTSIMKNNVWDIVEILKEKSMVSSKWIFKIKHVVDGNIDKFKDRFMARGFSQRWGVDY